MYFPDSTRSRVKLRIKTDAKQFETVEDEGKTETAKDGEEAKEMDYTGPDQESEAMSFKVLEHIIYSWTFVLMVRSMFHLHKRNMNITTIFQYESYLDFIIEIFIKIK